MADKKPFSDADSSRWATQRLELVVPIAHALREPEIAAALSKLGIDAAETSKDLLHRETLLNRFRATQSGLFGEDSDQRFPRMRFGLGPVYGTAVVIIYVGVLLQALPRMPVPAQLFGVLGLVSVCALAWRAARNDVVIVLRAIQKARNPTPTMDVLRDVVLPEVRQYLAEHSTPRYGTELPVTRTSDDVVEPATIVTSAGQRLRRLVQWSDADAIALAGPRGVGKTTTIRAVAEGVFSDIEEPPPLPIVAAAPSRYDARDFVLHLHAVLCRRIIALLNAHLRLPADTRWWRVRWRWFRPWSIVAGLLVLLFVTTRGLWRSSYPDFSAMLWERPERPPAPDASWPDPAPLVLLDSLRIVFALFVVGVSLHLLAVFVIVVRRAVTPHLTGTVRNPALVDLREEAHEQLQRTRFLQTHTEGWSGKIGLPSGSDMGVSRSLQRAEQALTHPEVVDNFRRFAQQCADSLVETGLASRLVIAIDELDKIAKPEQAHEFVNDVKGVFGVRDCLFLVSVSEDAMAAFERRGIPVRDAFDSAFTHMIRLDNFTLAESRRWLSRRLLGVPEQFTYLLHCLSGGLPRELQRAMNELVDIVREDNRSDLEHVAGALLDQELDRKAHAFAVEAQRFEESPELTDYLAELLTITDATADQVELAKRLVPDESFSELHRARWQSAGYLLFVATMRETFVNTLDAGGLAGVERLAQARALLAVNPQVAWRLVESVRASGNPDD